MVRTLAVSLLMLLVALPVVAEELGSAEAVAMEKYRTCLHRQIVDHDDGTSDTHVVGRAAMQDCVAEMDGMAKAAGEGETDVQRSAFRMKFETSVVDTVAGWVQLWRTTQRQVKEEAAGTSP